MPRRAFLTVLALVAAAHAATFIGYGPCDDDFIAYRYARNLIEGHGLVYNLGERVEGFSAPGWMLAVAAALKLGIAAPVFSLIASIASAAAAAFAVGELWARRHPDDRSHAPALLVAASPVIAWHAVLGLGTVALAALLAVAFERWDRAERAGRSTLAAAFAFGLATLVRNEALLLALPFVASELRRKRFATAGLALLPLAAWQTFRVLYYARFVPITYSVKKLAFADDLRFGFEYLARSSASTGIVIALGLALVVVLGGRELRDVGLRRAGVGVLLFALYVVYVGGDFLPHARFFVPVLPLAYFVACEACARWLPESRWLRAGVLVLALAFLQLPQLDRGELRAVHEHSEERWAALGREVARRVPPTTRVALCPIGAFGYESRLPIVDMLGLTNTAVARAKPDLAVPMKGHQRFDAEWVLSRAPEMIIVGNGVLEADANGVPTLEASHWERPLLEHARFASEYVPLAIDVEGSYPLIFYWRRDAPRPLGARDA